MTLARALTRSRDFERMRNKWEREYGLHLEAKKQRGEIHDWAYEPERLRLADDTVLIPDFRVIQPDGLVEFHEVKGHRWAKNWIKFKVAAEQHPYRFVLVEKNEGAWQLTEYP